jgi:asparagine synthase (glutamine-hydrolysing)
MSRLINPENFGAQKRGFIGLFSARTEVTPALSNKALLRRFFLSKHDLDRDKVTRGGVPHRIKARRGTDLMCGITGWIDWREDLTRQQAVLKAMTDRLTPRGPDAAGYWLAPAAALGHRRLIVIDPAGGKQPMVRTRGAADYVLVYNGELYNTGELRQELQRLGYCFQSYSDTEVVLIAYLEWGEKCVSRFNGIYAFAIWETAGERLYLARDRMGVKPLFYTRLGEGLLFASEIKALLAHPGIKAELDREGLAEVFGLGPARTPGRGVIKGVGELRPGCFLRFDRDGLQIRRYWELTSAPHPDDFPTTVARVRELTTAAIRRQLVSDVPVATFLSGGLDSSIITAVAAEAYRGEGRRLRTYSVDYFENERYFRADDFQPNADQPWVQIMSRYLGTNHRRVVLTTPELTKTLAAAVSARDLPGMADIDTSLWLFCRAIKPETTVVLSGECADEIFGGYPWFHRPDLGDATTFPWSRAMALREKLLHPGLRARLQLAEYVAQRYRESVAETPRCPGDDPATALRRELFYLNLNWFMAVLLERKDRMSMASGLEARVPFCDHHLVEYVWNIPWEYKYWSRREKGVLREAFRTMLPQEVVERKKSPYPKVHRPDYLEAVQAGLRQIWAGTTPLKELLAAAEIETLLATGCLTTPWFGQLMTGPQLLAFLIQLHNWLERYHINICI